MLHFLELLVVVGAILTLALMILLALPASRLRDLIMPYIAWSFVVLCGLYICLPIDFLPEILLGPAGLFDDCGALVAGVATAMKTIKASRDKQLHLRDPYFNN